MPTKIILFTQLIYKMPMYVNTKFGDNPVCSSRERVNFLKTNDFSMNLKNQSMWHFRSNLKYPANGLQLRGASFHPFKIVPWGEKRTLHGVFAQTQRCG